MLAAACLRVRVAAVTQAFEMELFMPNPAIQELLQKSLVSKAVHRWSITTSNLRQMQSLPLHALPTLKLQIKVKLKTEVRSMYKVQKAECCSARILKPSKMEHASELVCMRLCKLEHLHHDLLLKKS